MKPTPRGMQWTTGADFAELDSGTQLVTTRLKAGMQMERVTTPNAISINIGLRTSKNPAPSTTTCLKASTSYVMGNSFDIAFSFSTAH
ncbi:MAG TPA: hypothetical protein VIK15_10510, partial [Candidatus Anoxymicrobiaceae bacterium]